MDQVRAYLDQNKYKDAIDLLIKEADENPAHEAARVLLAETYEKADMPDKAGAAWRDLVALSRNDANLRKARRALARLRRQELDKQDLAETGKTDTSHDPFKLPMPPVDWKGLEVIEDNKYLPPILPPPLRVEIPPLFFETQHFTVYSTNERLSKVIAERA
jgi:tetratricopeptide (TPR) repeat protein